MLKMAVIGSVPDDDVINYLARPRHVSQTLTTSLVVNTAGRDQFLLRPPQPESFPWRYEGGEVLVLFSDMNLMVVRVRVRFR